MPIHCEAKHTIACHLIRYLLTNSLNGDCVTHEYTTSCRARDQAWPTNWIQVLVAAAAISSATASGFEAKGVWSTGKETTNASANVTIACFTSTTPARRGRVAGAACSYAGIGLRLQHTQLASARTDKKVSHVYSGLSIVVKSRNALVAPADQVCAETYFLELIPTNAAAVTDNRRREADFPLPVRTFFLSQQRPR